MDFGIAPHPSSGGWWVVWGHSSVCQTLCLRWALILYRYDDDNDDATPSVTSWPPSSCTTFALSLTLSTLSALAGINLERGRGWHQRLRSFIINGGAVLLLLLLFVGCREEDTGSLYKRTVDDFIKSKGKHSQKPFGVPVLPSSGRESPIYSWLARVEL